MSSERLIQDIEQEGEQYLYEFVWCYASNVLTIKWHLSTANIETRITSWKQGIEVINIEHDDSFTYELFQKWNLPFEINLQDPPLALQIWLNQIPEDLIRLSQQFTGYSLNILAMASRNKLALDLLRSNPNLLGMWFYYCADNGINEFDFYPGCGLKRVNLLSEMGFKVKPTMLKRINKCKLWDISPKNLKSVYSFIKQDFHLDQKKLIQHAEYLTTTFLKIVYVHDWFYASPLLKDTNLQPRDCKKLHLMLLRLEKHGIDSEKTMFLQCRTMDEFELAHNHFFARQDFSGEYPHFMLDDNGRLKKFPFPPIPESPAILAITDYASLWRHGEEMNHCAETFASKIMSGEYYIYQMVYPTKATIGLALDGGYWVLDQVRSYANSDVSDEVIRKVQEWHIFSADEDC